jgi:hypothetical protein
MHSELLDGQRCQFFLRTFDWRQFKILNFSVRELSIPIPLKSISNACANREEA